MTASSTGEKKGDEAARPGIGLAGAVTATESNADAEQRTLAENEVQGPRPEKVEPVDVEQRGKEPPGAHWSAGEVHEIPHK